MESECFQSHGNSASLQDMGFSQRDAQHALDDFDRRGLVPTINTLVEFLLQKRVQEDAAPAASSEVVASGPVDVVASLRMMLPQRLEPEMEERIRKHGCKDPCEALDLLEAWREQDRINLSATSATPREVQLDSDGEESEVDECWDDYDFGSTEPPQAGNEEDWEDWEEEEEEEEEHSANASSLKKLKTVTGERSGRCTLGKSSGQPVKRGKGDDTRHIGYGVPAYPRDVREGERHLEKSLTVPPYFYFENVAGMPIGQWQEIQRHLYDIEPEKVDSRHFAACRRHRGYVHNLPVLGRRLIIPEPPRTIAELYPDWGMHWPHWDPRKILHCISTKVACGSTVRNIKANLERAHNEDDPRVKAEIRKGIIQQMSKWNLVWTGPEQVSPMTPEEIELLMGYDIGHTRAIVDRDERLKALGNSFQVNTVAYHLSVLKNLYPRGINVISLFSGIGGAEVALHKNGIKMNVLVSVDKEERVRMVVDNFWQVTGQTGVLVHDIHNVQDLTRERLRSLMDRFGSFDLLIGGSPCNNLTGSNRRTRTGLQGTDSYMFHDYKRILSDLRDLAPNYERR